MDDETKLEETIQEGWEESKRRANYPTLRDPHIVEEIEGGAGFNPTTGEIIMGKKIIKDVVKTGQIQEDQAVTAIFDHEIAHYMVFPKNLATIITIGHFAENIFEEKTNYIIQTYADTVVDLNSTLKSSTKDDVLALRKALQDESELTMRLPNPGSKIRGMILDYLGRQVGDDDFYRSSVPEKVEEMMRIDFSRDANHEIGIYTYGKLIEDMIDEELSKCSGSRGGPGSGSGEPFEDIIKRASKKDIEDALREIMRDSSKGKYEKIRKWVSDKRGDTSGDSSESQAGIGESDLKFDEKTAQYYKELSRMFPVIITKRPRESTEETSLFGSTERWRAGKDPLLILPMSSGGKVLPGLTKNIKVTKKRKKTLKYEEPHALILKDSSGSMVNPNLSTKCFATLGSCIIARSYHARDQYVGVVNFDSGSSILPYSRDLDQIIRYITAYKGGGTSIDLEIVKKFLDMPEDFIEGIDSETLREYIKEGRVPKEALQKNISMDPHALDLFSDKMIDLYMFTDGDIMNQGEVLEYFAGLSNLNRAAIILTQGERDAFEAYNDKISIITVKDEKDLPRITAREVSKSLL